METEKKTATKPKATRTKKATTPKVKTIADNTMVVVRSNVKGELVYKSTKTGLMWTFHDYGDEDTMEFSELRNMVSSQRKFVEEGWIEILDEDVKKALKVERYEKNTISAEDIDELFEMNPEELKEIISSVKPSAKALIFDIAKEKYGTGELYDIRTIRAIEEVVGVALSENPNE